MKIYKLTTTAQILNYDNELQWYANFAAYYVGAETLAAAIKKLKLKKNELVEESEVLCELDAY